MYVTEKQQISNNLTSIKNMSSQFFTSIHNISMTSTAYHVATEAVCRFHYAMTPDWCHPTIAGRICSRLTGYSTHPSPQQNFTAPTRGTWGIPRPDKIYNTSSEFWVYRGLLPVGRAWKTSNGRHPNQIPELPQLAPFDEKEPTESRMLELLTLSLKLSPATLQRTLIWSNPPFSSREPWSQTLRC